MGSARVETDIRARDPRERLGSGLAARGYGPTTRTFHSLIGSGEPLVFAPCFEDDLLPLFSLHLRFFFGFLRFFLLFCT